MFNRSAVLHHGLLRWEPGFRKNELSVSRSPAVAKSALSSSLYPSPSANSVTWGKFPSLTQAGDNPFLDPKPQGQFVVVSMTVQNIGDEPQSFSPSSQKLIDVQGREFENDTSAQISLGGSDITVWDNINPGNSVQVKVVYDMPTDAVPASIKLHDSMLSNGVTVSLTP